MGLRTYDLIGMTETGGPGMGIECDARDGIHVWDDHYLPEIVEPATGRVLPDGERGELVVTTLTRQGLPLVRYRTRDITRVRSRERCACGRTGVRLDRFHGRTDDMVIFKGVNFYPSQVEQILLRQPGLGPRVPDRAGSRCRAGRPAGPVRRGRIGVRPGRGDAPLARAERRLSLTPEIRKLALRGDPAARPARRSGSSTGEKGRERHEEGGQAEGGPRTRRARGASGARRRGAESGRRRFPAGYHTVTPHLTVRGAADAIDVLRARLRRPGAGADAGPRRQDDHARGAAGSGTRSCSWRTSCPTWAAAPRDAGRRHRLAPSLRAGRGPRPSSGPWPRAPRCGCRSRTCSGATATRKVTDPFGHEWGLATHKEDLLGARDRPAGRGVLLADGRRVVSAAEDARGSAARASWRETPHEALPKPAVEMGRLAVLDWWGVTVGGVDEPVARLLRGGRARARGPGLGPRDGPHRLSGDRGPLERHRLPRPRLRRHRAGAAGSRHGAAPPGTPRARGDAAGRRGAMCSPRSCSASR